MNIAFLLLPKKDVTCLFLHDTMRHALEKMEYHSYTALPLIDEDGKYAGTITEGDLLSVLIKNREVNLEDTDKILLRDLHQKVKNDPVRVDALIGDLFSLAINQNFIPVVDDQGIFIGIVRRRDILEYYAGLLKENNIFS